MTQQPTTKAALTALTLGLTLGLAACGGTDAGSTSSAAPQMSQMPPASASASASSSTAAQFNDADVMFVKGMLPHHQQAVEMSDTLLKKTGISAETRALAEQINAAQQPEIDVMKGWLTAWGENADSGMGMGMGHGGGGMGGGGMATDAEMKKFERSDGAKVEQMYLEMMTAHHQGAITMAKTEIADGQNPEAVQLANVITTTQQAEIDTMKQLLTKL